MAEYSYYLFRISWPAGTLLVILFLFVMARVTQKVKVIRLHEWDEWGILILVTKIIFWSIILFIYLVIFFHHYPDWLTKPAEVKGYVENIDYDRFNERYYIEINDDVEKPLIKLWVDEEIFRKVKLGSEVRVNYLLFRKEGYSCEVLYHPNYG